MAAPALTPLRFIPRQVSAIWGGDALATRFHKPADPAAVTGESWECYDANLAVDASGASASLAQWRERLGEALTGESVDVKRAFPLLTKFIDARQSLSVQVHPDDDYARRIEHQHNGKTECWVVLAAEPGAEIVLGWTRDTSREEYRERVRDGTLGDLLRRVPARTGDIFYLPAGTLHAIGAGIVVYETQQMSDLTYRIFDWNRMGSDGKPRELHVDKAADVLDFRAGTRGAIAPVSYELGGLHHTVLVGDANFTVERVTATSSPHGLDLEDGPLVVTALDHPVELIAHGTTVRLAAFETALVPAGLDVVLVRADDDGAEFLTAAPPRRADTLAHRLSRAAVPVDEATAFLAQF